MGNSTCRRVVRLRDCGEAFATMKAATAHAQDAHLS